MGRPPAGEEPAGPGRGRRSAPLAPGTALDLGCGTGDNSIYLAKHGWQVTGVDYVAKPLDKARAKAAANKVAVNFAQADVTRLLRRASGRTSG